MSTHDEQLALWNTALKRKIGQLIAVFYWGQPATDGTRFKHVRVARLLDHYARVPTDCSQVMFSVDSFRQWNSDNLGFYVATVPEALIIKLDWAYFPNIFDQVIFPDNLPELDSIGNKTLLCCGTKNVSQLLVQLPEQVRGPFWELIS